jgi:hypothetical protein
MLLLPPIQQAMNKWQRQVLSGDWCWMLVLRRVLIAARPLDLLRLAL